MDEYCWSPLGDDLRLPWPDWCDSTLFPNILRYLLFSNILILVKIWFIWFLSLLISVGVSLSQWLLIPLVHLYCIIPRAPKCVFNRDCCLLDFTLIWFHANGLPLIYAIAKPIWLFTYKAWLRWKGKLWLKITKISTVLFTLSSGGGSSSAARGCCWAVKWAALMTPSLYYLSWKEKPVILNDGYVLT